MNEQRQRNWREYFDNEYLTGDQLDQDGTTFTIADKSRGEVEDGGEKKHKLVLTFTDGNKWLTNHTNCTYMEHMFGSKAPASWIGKRVTLAYDPSVKFGRETVGGIRVIGSPDLDAPVTFLFQENTHKRPKSVTLHPTGKTPSGAQKAAKPPVGAGAVKTPENGSESQEDDGMDFWPGGDA